MAPTQKAQITAKNLEILSELMLIEELAYKKCETYASMFSDKELGNTCKTLAKNHRARFTSLFDYLNNHE